MSGFEEFLVAFEAGSPAERWRFPEQSARLKRAVTEAMEYRATKND